MHMKKMNITGHLLKVIFKGMFWAMMMVVSVLALACTSSCSSSAKS